MKTKQLKFSMFFILLISLGIGFYSCKDDPDESGTNGLTQEDRDFASKLSAGNIAEIQFGRLAVQRATVDSVLLFAQQMITDHNAAQSELDSIGRQLSIALPDSMDTAHRTLYTFLSGRSGFVFDSIYIHNQVIDHQNTRDLLQKEIDNGQDSLLVRYARKQLPIVIMHHERALQLRSSVNEREKP